MKGSAVMLVLVAFSLVLPATADEPASAPQSVLKSLPDVQDSAGVSTALKWVALVTVLALAPAILIMVTSFTRIVVVLGLLRQALATHQLPPNQILFGLALLMTIVVMAPVYTDVHRDAISPYFDGKIDQAAALSAGHARFDQQNQLFVNVLVGGQDLDATFF